MGDEMTFRTSVGGYRKDDVLEYVENMNDQIFHMKKTQQEETARYQSRMKELEELLHQEAQKVSELNTQQTEKINVLEEANAGLNEANVKLQEELNKMELRWKTAMQEKAKLEAERNMLKEKLGREVLRLRSENQKLTKRAETAEKNAACRGDYEAVRDVVSEVQSKIAEYVNVINKTQQSLATSYQSMNGIKKRISEKLDTEGK